MYQLLRQYNVRLGGTERGPFRVLHRVGPKPVRQLEKMGVFPLQSSVCQKPYKLILVVQMLSFFKSLLFDFKETLASLRVIGLLTVDDRMIQQKYKEHGPNLQCRSGNFAP